MSLEFRHIRLAGSRSALRPQCKTTQATRNLLKDRRFLVPVPGRPVTTTAVHVIARELSLSGSQKILRPRSNHWVSPYAIFTTMNGRPMACNSTNSN